MTETTECLESQLKFLRSFEASILSIKAYNSHQAFPRRICEGLFHLVLTRFGTHSLLCSVYTIRTAYFQQSSQGHFLGQ